jgi:hypothetical protein
VSDESRRVTGCVVVCTWCGVRGALWYVCRVRSATVCSDARNCVVVTAVRDVPRVRGTVFYVQLCAGFVASCMSALVLVRSAMMARLQVRGTASFA